jgi:type II secretion system protein J
VFAIVLAAMNGVFYGALRLRNKTSDSVDAALPSQRALEVIRRDLSNLVLPGGTISGSFNTTSTTNMMLGQSSPNFYTASGLIDDTSPWADVQRVTYALVSSTDRTASGRDLVRATTRNLLPVFNEDQPVQEWMMSGVQDLRFTYYDGNQWRDSWDSTTTDLSTGRTNVLPQAIKVQIRLAPPESGAPRLDAPIELVVPIVVQSRTNLTQQTGGGTP